MNVLLSRPDRVGDVVISTTLIPALRATVGVGRICFLGREDVRGLVAKRVDAFFAIEATDLADQLRAAAVDVSLHLHPHQASLAAVVAAGVPRRIGWVTDGPGLTDTLPYTKDRGDRHEAEHGFDLAAKLGVSRPDSLGPCIAVEAPVELLAAARPVLVLHLGASPGKARLPERLTRAVARAWIENGGAVTLVGAESEREEGEALATALGPASVSNLCGRLTLPELAGVSAAAMVFVGRDSGPAHLAAAAGGNVVVIFPSARPDMSVVRWRPLGERVTVIELPGKARWWEKTERASERLLAKADVPEIVRRVLVAAGSD